MSLSIMFKLKLLVISIVKTSYYYVTKKLNNFNIMQLVIYYSNVRIETLKGINGKPFNFTPKFPLPRLKF